MFNLIKLFIILFSLNLFANTLNVSVNGNNETGDGSFDNPYATIQKGVDEASPNDTVYVFDGIYDGGIIINDKPLTLLGQSREETKINIIRSTPQISIIDVQDDTVRISNFRIKRGSSNRGGGIFSSNSIAVINNSDFSHNISSSHGGAIFADSSYLKVENSLFFLNTSDSLGGSIYGKSSYIELHNLELRNNSAWAGGAIGIDSLTNCIINNSKIFNNGASAGGGVAIFDDGKLSLRNSDIYDNNTATWDIPSVPDPDIPLYGGGGGLYMQFSDSLEITNSNFENNTSNNGPGGGLVIYHSKDIELNDVDLIGNSAPGGGGGLMIVRSENVNYSNGLVKNNQSTANSGGGIFYSTETNSDTLIIQGSLNRIDFIDNYAQIGGGGLFLWSAEVNVYNSTFSQNEANDNNGESNWSGGGLASHFMAEPNIINCIFYDNSPNSIHNGNPGTPVRVKYSLLEEFWSGVENLIDIDPLFKSPENGDFSLQPNSPCIDAGMSDFDYDGIDEINDYLGAAPDLGSTEFMLDPPLGFNGSILDSSVVLTWLHITDPGFQYYKIEQSNDSLFNDEVLELYITENTHTTENLNFDSTYFFRVSAFVGYWTDYSPVLAFTLETLELEKNMLHAQEFNVSQNFPNPFNPITSIQYTIPVNGFVDIIIYDMKGRVVKNLKSDYEVAGTKNIQWNATDNFGTSVPTGMYIYSVKAGPFLKNTKMILLK